MDPDAQLEELYRRYAEEDDLFLDSSDSDSEIDSEGIARKQGFVADELGRNDPLASEDDSEEEDLDQFQLLQLQRMERERAALLIVSEAEDYFDDSDAPGGPETESNFDYTRRWPGLSANEKLSLAFNDISVSHNVPRSAVAQYRRCHDAENRPSDYRTARRLMRKLTGVGEVRYDCCPMGCISYSLPRYRDLDRCPAINKEGAICGHARFAVKNGVAIPNAQHSYIPVTHRLKLRWADKQTAREMLAYKSLCKSNLEKGIRSDFWTGQFYVDQKARGLYQDDTDMAFMLTTDGVKVFKTRDDFTIWPIMLVCILLFNFKRLV